MKLRVPLLTLGLLVLTGTPGEAADPTGVWLTEEGKARVRLSECGKNLCSEIIWLRQPNDERGKPLRDHYNPDPKLRNRPIIGIEILQGLQPTGKGWQGHIYNPENGKTYIAHVTLPNPNVLLLKGCVSFGWPCGEQTWTRDKESASKKPPQQQQTAKVTPPPQQPPAPRVQSDPGPQPRTVETPPREAPQPRTQQFATVTPPAQTREQPTFQQQQPPQPVQTRPRPEPQVPPVTQQPPPRGDVTASLPRPTQPQPPTLPAATGFHVQVLARQSEGDALEAYASLQKRFPDLLARYQPTLQVADLGAKGVWYRVRVGPMEQRNTALLFCERIKSMGGDCIVRDR